MTEQLVLELAPPEPPSFDNFLPGANAEAIDALRRVAEGRSQEPGLVLWGPPGAGRTHLLRAAVAAASAHKRPVRFASGAMLAAMQPTQVGAHALVAIDDVHTLDAGAQGRLFTLYNTVRAQGGHVVAASDAPPARLPLREDLRTRLGWGLVYELVPLADADKPAALVRYARTRGFALDADVIAYLLAHGRRDMTTLLATLAALDRHSLANRRPVTVALLRQWLQRDPAR